MAPVPLAAEVFPAQEGEVIHHSNRIHMPLYNHHAEDIFKMEHRHCYGQDKDKDKDKDQH